jgi:hypothetical protein
LNFSAQERVEVFVLSPETEDRDEVKVATGRSTKRPTLNDIHILFYLQADHTKKIGEMLQMTLHLTRSMWTFQLLGLKVLQKKATSTVSMWIHKGAIFDGLKINI